MYQSSEQRRQARLRRIEADQTSALAGFLFCMMLILFLVGMFTFGPSI